MAQFAAGIPQSNFQSKLYEQDFVAWCEDTVAKLKAQKFSELDLESLIEEIDGLAGRDRRELESYLDILLTHLLKRVYINHPDDYRGWEATIREQRRQLQLLLNQSPSLRNYFTAVFDESWQYASREVRDDYPQTQLPIECPFSRDVEALLTQAFWQNSEA